MQCKSEPSPLARGTRPPAVNSIHEHRFIPAYAGNSQTNLHQFDSYAVHPRLRGELAVNGRLNSSGTRFIPAYAGNSSHFQFPNRIWTVHPCLRGELQTHKSAVLTFFGSSPLTRGTLGRVFQLIDNLRFIPAYAGNSRSF